MKLGTQVGLGPGHIVLDRDPTPPFSKKGTEPSPNFRPMFIVAKRLDGSRCQYGGRPRPKRHCVTWGPSSPSPKRGQSPQFLAHIYCGQTGAWINMPLGMVVGFGPWHTVIDGDPAPLPKNGAQPPQFRPMFVVAKRLDCSRCHLVRW